jgi:hypothetical protein
MIDLRAERAKRVQKAQDDLAEAKANRDWARHAYEMAAVYLNTCVGRIDAKRAALDEARRWVPDDDLTSANDL